MSSEAVSKTREREVEGRWRCGRLVATGRAALDVEDVDSGAATAPTLVFHTSSWSSSLQPDHLIFSQLSSSFLTSPSSLPTTLQQTPHQFFFTPKNPSFQSAVEKGVHSFILSHHLTIPHPS